MKTIKIMTLLLAATLLAGCGAMRREQREFSPISVEGAACKDSCDAGLKACKQEAEGGRMENKKCVENYQNCLDNCKAADEGILQKAFGHELGSTIKE